MGSFGGDFNTHELAHQWFEMYYLQKLGKYLANEGLLLSEAIFTEAAGGKTAYDNYI
jgi:hypothetical protein